ncbi:hypothetical protein [Longimicrobium sp.]|uniref:hypothetical protein n=1 Tax=Longimicrobium sp. TaxID=2029185 RepID=UPI003B3B6DCB
MSRMFRGLPALFALSLLACESTPSIPPEPVPALLEPRGGGGQTALVGAPLPEPLRVAVTSSRQTPMAGVWVRWQVPQGGGRLSVDSSRTDAAGVARAELTLGTQPGPWRVTAGVAGLAPVEFTGTAQSHCQARIVRSLRIAGGDGQSALTHDSLAAPLQVQALCDDATPLAGVTVQWSVPGGNATAGAPASVTDANGMAATSLRLGAAPGPVALYAGVGAQSLEFRATALDRCAPRATLSAGEVAGRILSVDCDQDPGLFGRSRFAVYTLRMEHRQLVRLELDVTAGGYRNELKLWDAEGTRQLAAAEGWMNVLLEPGTYRLWVAVTDPAATGATYRLVRRDLDAPPCTVNAGQGPPVWLVRPTVSEGALSPDNCGHFFGAPGRYDHYVVRLRAGEGVDVSLRPQEGLNAALAFGVSTEGGFALQRYSYPAGGEAADRLVAPADGNYAIVVITSDATTGKYVLQLY